MISFIGALCDCGLEGITHIKKRKERLKIGNGCALNNVTR